VYENNVKSANVRNPFEFLTHFLRHYTALIRSSLIRCNYFFTLIYIYICIRRCDSTSFIYSSAIIIIFNEYKIIFDKSTRFCTLNARLSNTTITILWLNFFMLIRKCKEPRYSDILNNSRFSLARAKLCTDGIPRRLHFIMLHFSRKDSLTREIASFFKILLR